MDLRISLFFLTLNEMPGTSLPSGIRGSSDFRLPSFLLTDGHNLVEKGFYFRLCNRFLYMNPIIGNLAKLKETKHPIL